MKIELLGAAPVTEVCNYVAIRRRQPDGAWKTVAGRFSRDQG